MKTEHLIFVYGTLKQGKGNHGFLRNAHFMGNVETEESFYFAQSGIPFVLDDPSLVRNHNKKGETLKGKVVGELYLCSSETLIQIDTLEGHPTGYRRKPVVVIHGNAVIEAEGYFFQHPVLCEYPDENGKHIY